MNPSLNHDSIQSRAGIAEGFRRAREATGMSPHDLASVLGTSSPAIHDLESNNDELFSCYSPNEVRLISEAVGISPSLLLKCETIEGAISGDELIVAIQTRLREAPHSMAEFEDCVGWRIGQIIDTPEHLLSDLSVDGLQWLCAELGIDWQRVVAGL